MPLTQETETIIVRTLIGEHQISEDRYLNLYDDNSIEIVDHENFISGNMRGEEYVCLDAEEVKILKTLLGC